jgi:hypothetical protein
MGVSTLDPIFLKNTLKLRTKKVCLKWRFGIFLDVAVLGQKSWQDHPPSPPSPLPPFLILYIYVILYQMLASASINGIPLAAPQEWVPDPSHKPVASIVTVSIVVVVRTSNPLVIGINNDLFMNIIPNKT